MEIRYITSEDDLFEISNIYEKSWKYAYRNIIPQDFLDSIPAGRWADKVNAKGIYSLVLTKGSVPVGTASFCRSRWQEYSGCGEITALPFRETVKQNRSAGNHCVNSCIYI